MLRPWATKYPCHADSIFVQEKLINNLILKIRRHSDSKVTSYKLDGRVVIADRTCKLSHRFQTVSGASLSTQRLLFPGVNRPKPEANSPLFHDQTENTMIFTPTTIHFVEMTNK